MSTCNGRLQACNDPIAGLQCSLRIKQGGSSTEMSCLQPAMAQFQLITVVLHAYNEPITACNDSLQINNGPVAVNNNHY
jgi:hypothetical protein